MQYIGISSYLFGGLSYSALVFLAATSWKGRQLGAWVIAVAAATALWCVVGAILMLRAEASLAVGLAFETIRDVVWLVFLQRVWREIATGGLPRGIALGAGLLWAGALVVVLISAFASQRASLSNETSKVISVGFIVISLMGLFLVEQIYKNSSPDRLWAIKYLCYAAGGVFAYDLYVYSLSLLYGHIGGMAWDVRGAVNGLMAPLLAIAMVRNPTWSIELFVSRQVVIHTATFLIAGIYLVAMAAVAYLIRAYEGEWGGAIQLAFIAGSGALLVAILRSGQIGSRLKVFVVKHFYRNKYDYRQEWLRFMHTLGEDDGTSVQERAIKAVAQIVGSSGGILWERKDRNYAPTYSWDMSMPEDTTIDPDNDVIGLVRQKTWVIELQELVSTQETDAQRDILMTVPELWLLVPLFREQDLYGFIVLVRPKEAAGLNWEDFDLLKTVGRQIAIHLAESNAAKALSQAKQFEAYSKVSTYVLHDLKNLISQLSLLLKNSERHKRNPEFIDDTFKTLSLSIQKAKTLMEQLRTGRSGNTNEVVDLVEVLRTVVDQSSRERPIPDMACGEKQILVRADRERLIRIFTNLVQNAQQAVLPSSGRVGIAACLYSSETRVDITDNGRGMDGAFIREQLFTPFETTKGSGGMGIGVYEAREYIRALGGDVQVRSKPESGTTFTLRIPLAVSETPDIMEQRRACS